MTKKLRLKPETVRPLDLDGVRGGIFVDEWFWWLKQPKKPIGPVHPDDVVPFRSFIGCPSKSR